MRRMNDMMGSSKGGRESGTGFLSLLDQACLIVRFNNNKRPARADTGFMVLDLVFDDPSRLWRETLTLLIILPKTSISCTQRQYKIQRCPTSSTPSLTVRQLLLSALRSLAD